MKNVALFSKIILLLTITQMCRAQSYFDVDNKTSCAVEARAYAYSYDNPGDCPSNCNTLLYTTSWITCPPGITRISSAPSSGQWGAIFIRPSGGGSSMSDGDCISPSGSLTCGAPIYVVWDNCNNATVDH